MKKIILFFISCVFFSIFPSDNGYYLIKPITIPCTQQHPFIPLQPFYYCAQEGFSSDTLVKTLDGYQHIQDLQQGDIVCSYDPDTHLSNTTIVTDVFSHQVSEFMRLTKNDIIIDVALEQTFFLPLHNQWTKAFFIKPSDVFLAHDGSFFSFDKVECIIQDMQVYCITVQDHVFAATTLDVVVHNTAALITAPSIVFNFIQLMQPVIIMLGATLSLNSVNISTKTQLNSNEQNSCIAPSAEKAYFDQKIKQLGHLKQNITNIHSCLKMIKSNFADEYALLHYQPIKITHSFPNMFAMTAQWEADLPEHEKIALTQAREQILDNLEEEICTIQIAIGTYINELLYRKDQTIKFHQDYINRGKITYIDENTPYSVMKNCYKFTLVNNMLLSEIINRNKEMSTVIQFFERYPSNSIIHKTTNIMTALAQQKTEIEANIKLVNKAKQDNDVSTCMHLNYFYNHTSIPNLSKEIEAIKTELYHTFQSDMKNRCQDKNYSTTKLKPQPFDEDDDSPRKYEKSPKHPDFNNLEQLIKYLDKGISPSPQDGQSALDRSIKIAPGIPARATIQDGYFVIFFRTRQLPEGGSIYHGFIETWNSFKQRHKYKNKLVESGLITEHGKIL